MKSKTGSIVWAYTIIFLFFVGIFILTSCMIFSSLGGGSGSGTIGSSDSNGIFVFRDLSTGSIFSNPITPSATVEVYFRYKGIAPVKSLELSVIRDYDSKEWVSNNLTSTKTATLAFTPNNNAGDFTANATVVDLYGKTRRYSKGLKVLDESPPTVTVLEFYPVDGKLIPNDENQPLFFMVLEDEESPIFTDRNMVNLRENTRVYLNGRDISNSFFTQDADSQPFFTGSNNKMVMIAKINLNDLQEGTSTLRIVMGDFKPDENDFVQVSTPVYASYPDNTPPNINNIDYPDDEFSSEILAEFKVLENFNIGVETRDKGDAPGYKVSGLDTLKVVIFGSNNHTETFEVDCQGLEYGYFVIPVDVLTLTDGLYNLYIEVSDKNGNIAKSQPVIFQLGVQPVKMLSLSVEKTAGEMNVDDFIYGDTLKFTVDDQIVLSGITWSPSILLPQAGGYSALWEGVTYGSHLISVSGTYNNKQAYGYLTIEVLPTPTSHDLTPPEVVLTVSEAQNPFIPFKVNVADKVSLGNNPSNVMNNPPTALKFDSTGNITPLLVNFFTTGNDIYISEYNRYMSVEYQFSLTTIGEAASPLTDGERVELRINVRDEKGNVSNTLWKFPTDFN